MIISGDNLVKQLQWRYAVKKFDPAKKISDENWAALENALILTPSSYGLQPWKFLVITNPALREKLTPASWNQKQVVDCSHYVVFLVKKTMTEKDIALFINATASTRNTPREKLSGYEKMMVSDLVYGARSKMIREWASHQVYIALGNLMTSAAMLGIDTCPMEGFEPEKYDETLGLKDTDYASLVCCAVGYRSSEDAYAKAAKVRYGRAHLFEYRS